MGFFGGRRPGVRERLARFMMGRNGADAFYHFLVAVCCIIVVVNVFVNSLTLTVVETVLIFYAFFRAMSRNVYKRQRENAAFLKILEKPNKLLGVILFNSRCLRYGFCFFFFCPLNIYAANLI